MVLETTLNIYKRLNVDNLKICQIGGGKDSGAHKDIVGGIISSMNSNFKLLEKHWLLLEFYKTREF